MKAWHLFKSFSVLLCGLILFSQCTLHDEPTTPQNTATEQFEVSLQKSGGNCVPAPSDLVGWWPGDGNVIDIAGGNNATLLNGATFAAGKVGQAFSFDGVNDYAEIPSSANLQLTTTFTADAWINLSVDMTTHGQSAMIVGKGFDAEAPIDWALTVTGTENSINPGTLRPHVNANGNWIYFDCNTVLQPNTWYHVAIVYDGSNLRGYLNGVLDGSTPATGAIQVSIGSLRIGAYAPVNGISNGGSKHFFPGRIDEVEIFNRALTVDEIAAIYNAGSAGKCKEVTICHKPGTPAQKTLVVPVQALAGHLGHGDTIGPCQ